MDGESQTTRISYDYIMTQMELPKPPNGSHKKGGKPTIKQVRDGIDTLVEKGFVQRINVPRELILKLVISPKTSEKTKSRVNPSPGGRAEEGQTSKGRLESSTNKASSGEEGQRKGRPGRAGYQEYQDINKFINKKEKYKKEKSSEFREAGQRVIAHLDSVAEIKRRGESDAYWHDVKFVQDRLKGGATEQECIAVIDLKARDDWFIENGYLRSSTLFNKTKFASYVREIYAKPKSKSNQGNIERGAGKMAPGRKSSMQQFWETVSEGLNLGLDRDNEQPREIVINPDTE